MITFKNIIRTDIDRTFMNLNEFAGTHTVNGKEMPVDVDNNELIDREKKSKSKMDGVYTRSLLIYVRGKDFGPLPTINSKLTLDGKIFLVRDATNEDGLYSLELEATRS